MLNRSYLLASTICYAADTGTGNGGKGRGRRANPEDKTASTQKTVGEQFTFQPDKEVLTERVAIIAGYREPFEDGLEDMPDDVLWALIRHYPGGGAEVEAQRLEALENWEPTTVEDLTAPPRASTVDASAKVFGEALAGKDVLVHLAEGQVAQAVYNGAPVVVASDLAVLIKDKTIPPISEWPLIGVKHDKMPADAGNQRPDGYKGIDGGKGGTWTADAWDSIPGVGVLNRTMNQLCQLANERLAALSMEERVALNRYLAPTGIVVDNLAKENSYTNAVDYINQVRTTQIAIFRKAMRYLQKRAEILYRFPLVGVAQMSSNPAELSRMKKPVCLTHKTQDMAGQTESERLRAMSLSNFVRINFERALEIRKESMPTARYQDVTAADLRQTVGKRKPKGGPGAQGGDADKSGKSAKIIWTTAAQFESAVAGFGLFFDETDDGYDKRMADLTNDLAADDGKERVEMMGDAINKWNAYFASSGLGDVYVEIKKAKGSAAMERLKASLKKAS